MVKTKLKEFELFCYSRKLNKLGFIDIYIKVVYGQPLKKKTALYECIDFKIILKNIIDTSNVSSANRHKSHLSTLLLAMSLTNTKRGSIQGPITEELHSQPFHFTHILTNILTTTYERSPIFMMLSR